MAWRIHDSVIRGEIDNRTRGRITGKLWLHGATEPVELNLRGNAHADLAGCRMEFVNPAATIAMRTDATFSSPQIGTAGDITASRKVRVLDLPVDEWLAAKRAGKPAPEHWGNSLYIEWFSERNGRVVVEIADCEVTVSEPEWRMSAEDEAKRAEDASQGFADFMGKLTEAVSQAEAEVPDHDEEWDEFDHEKFMRESDARTDKYMELLEKYGTGPDAEEIIAREMGWDVGGADDDDADETTGWEMPDLSDIPDPVPIPLTEGVDWVRDEHGGIQHPLQKRSFEAAMALWHAVDELDLKDDDEDVAEMTFKFQQTSAKLAGALNSLGYDGRRNPDLAPATVARLKRALNHLHECQAAMTRVKEKGTVPDTVIRAAESELFAVREEILRLMEEFRGL